MKFSTQQKVPPCEPVLGVVVGWAGMCEPPGCSVAFLAFSCCCMDVLSPSAGELSG